MTEVMTHLVTRIAMPDTVMVQPELLVFGSEGPPVVLIEVSPVWNTEEDTVTDVHIVVTAGGLGPEPDGQIEFLIATLRNILEILEDGPVDAAN